MPDKPWYSRDLTHPGWIIAKGLAFLVVGALAVTLSFIWPGKGWVFAGTYAVSIWAFCRFYYFAFYVITNYVDPSFRYAGLIDFLKYWFRDRRKRN